MFKCYLEKLYASYGECQVHLVLCCLEYDSHQCVLELLCIQLSSFD